MARVYMPLCTAGACLLGLAAAVPVLLWLLPFDAPHAALAALLTLWALLLVAHAGAASAAFALRHAEGAAEARRDARTAAVFAALAVAHAAVLVAVAACVSARGAVVSALLWAACCGGGALLHARDAATTARATLAAHDAPFLLVPASGEDA
jgi:hypothetical protein